MRAAWIAFALLGCARLNVPLERHDPSVGYRQALTKTDTNTDSLYIAMSFSGGGTRAAAYAYGALNALHETQVEWEGKTRRLTDEVDLISSVSGGSFTSAYFGLFGDRTFSEFRERVLDRNLEWSIAWRLFFVPWITFRLMSRVYDRIHVTQAVYSETIFDEKSFADMGGPDKKPFVVLDGTNISLGRRFEFTQDRFDMIGSDLDEYPVGFAVAASAAFPVGFSPVTLENFPAPKGLEEPRWVEPALDRYATNRDKFRRARAWRDYADKDKRPWLHVLDGGLADNTGARYILESLKRTTQRRSIGNLISTKKIRRLLVVTVNAKGGLDPSADKQRVSPDFISVVSAAGTTAMDNYTDDSIDLIEHMLRETAEAYGSEAGECVDPKTCACRIEVPAKDVVFYIVDVSFDAIPQARRGKFEDIPTRLTLDESQVNRLVKEGRRQVLEAPCFERMIADVGAAR